MELRHYFDGILKGVIASIVTTILLTAILSIVMLFASLDDTVFNISYVVITCLAIIIGSIISAKAIGKKGWIVGLIVGCIYYIVLYLLSIIFGGEATLGIYDLYRFIISMVVGVLSGMLGINLFDE